MTSTPDPRPHVVIVGGGFGGLYAARELAGAPVEVTLIDRRNHHLFQPLLYQVATAGLNPSDIAYPIRSVLRKQKNARVLLGEVTGVEPEGRQVVLDEGRVDYDYLIVATGATHSYFGNEAWARYAPGLKSIEDALDIRRRVLLAYEAAERETDLERRRAWLTFVVVGGGPTGVELAGALAEIALHTVARDFRSIDPRGARVLLVEADDRLLKSYDPGLSAKARAALSKRGVEVVLGSLVTEIDAEGVRIGSERIEARTALWAAGVQASPLGKSLGAPLDRAGRVRVERDLSVPGHPEIFVIGDLAAVECDGEEVPGVAPAAIQGGVHAARSIRRSLQGVERNEFRYRDKGSLATIGRAAAVAERGRFKLSGFLAWVAWWAVHILFLIGFRSKFLVMFSWAWSYLTFQRGARLITGTSGSPARSLAAVEEAAEPRDEDPGQAAS